MTAVRARHARPRGIGPWMVVPAIILLGVFVYAPIFRGAQLSLFGSDLLGNPTRFVGLTNYGETLADPRFFGTLGTSLAIALLSMALGVVIALVAALLLRRWIPGRRLWRVIFSLPFAYSAASASAVFFGLFAPSVGLLNVILGAFGIPGLPWLNDPILAVVAISIATAWFQSGFAFLVFTASLSDIPPEIVEAAQLDGASNMRVSWSVIIPQLRPSILFLVVTQTINGLQTFTQVQILTKGGPSNSTTTLVYQLYQLAFGNGIPDYGRASVIAILLVAVVALVTWAQFRVFGRNVA